MTQPEHSYSQDGSRLLGLGSYADQRAEQSYSEAYNILRAYGCLAPTQAEQRAYAEVLDRMGAFAPTERQVLISAGMMWREATTGSEAGGYRS